MKTSCILSDRGSAFLRSLLPFLHGFGKESRTAHAFNSVALMQLKGAFVRESKTLSFCVLLKIRILSQVPYKDLLMCVELALHLL